MSHRLSLVALALLLLTAAGCSRADEPVRVSREALGTVVTIEAWGEDRAPVEAAIDEAFVAIANVEHELDAYSATSTISAFNADPYESHVLPTDAVTVLDTVEHLGVGDAFSPSLLGVVRLYDFSGAKTIPAPVDLALAVDAAHSFRRLTTETAVFEPLRLSGERAGQRADITPGLDFGGAAKGLALDRAREALRAGAVSAAIVSAGSTTVTLGDKPDGEPWRVGVEDAREPGVSIAIAEWDGEAALSTSGDYQQYFERGDVRYHHILDPETGEPARQMRTLTVVGRISGLESDILSTALFVRGRDDALRFAAAEGLGVHLTDSEGRTHLAPAPADSGITIAEE